VDTHKPLRPIGAEVGEPIIFRTTSRAVYEASVTAGSLWLRSDEYFRQVEDKARKDRSEGINSGASVVPLLVQAPNGVQLQIQGPGYIGQQIRPHYILSMHGSSISEEQLLAFGGCTFGIRSLAKLAAEILYRCSLFLKTTSYRYGQVFYQHAALSQLHHPAGGAAIQVCESPPVYLNPINTDVLRKLPLKPFIEQDEWRIAVFTDGYLNGEPIAPSQINVSPDHFYAYLLNDGVARAQNVQPAA
jgi:hypothetical protein